MPINLIGLNFKTAPIEIRETIQGSLDTASLFSKMGTHEGFQGAVLLKTCNRIELYAHGGQSENILFEGHEIDASMTYQKQGQDAVSHLFTVSSSLDSMVVGEPQILGQVKQAYEYSKSHQYISPLLDRVFQKAFRVAKRVRTETSIGDYSVSLSSIAVDLSKEFFETLNDKEVLLVGAGQMAELAAKHFQKRDISKLWIMNRSFDHAVKLAKKTNGNPLKLDYLKEKIVDIDILMVSTGANQHLLSAQQMKPFLAARKQRPLLCIDISVPRNLDPEIHNLENVYLYDIDDLQNVVDQHIEIRQSEAKEALDLVEKEVSQFVHSLHLPSISNTIQKIHKKVSPVCDQEVRRLTQQLGLSKEQAARVKKSFEHMADKLLLNPVMYIQDTKDKEDRDKRLGHVRDVFLVDMEDE